MVGQMYKIINKRSKHYDEMGIVVDVNNEMILLARIRPVSDLEYNMRVEECRKTMCVISERHINPLMYVNKRSVDRIYSRDLSDREKETIKKAWLNIKKTIIKRNFVLGDALIKTAVRNNSVLV